MGPWGTLARILIALMATPAVLLLYPHGSPALSGANPRVFGPVLAGAGSGLIGTAIESFAGVRLNALERFLFWAGMTAIVIYTTEAEVPGFGLSIGPALAAGAFVGLLEMALPAPLTRR